MHLFKVMLTVGQGLKRGCSKLGNTGHLYKNKASLMSRQGWEARFLLLHCYDKLKYMVLYSDKQMTDHNIIDPRRQDDSQHG